VVSRVKLAAFTVTFFARYAFVVTIPTVTPIAMPTPAVVLVVGGAPDGAARLPSSLKLVTAPRVVSFSSLPLSVPR